VQKRKDDWVFYVMSGFYGIWAVVDLRMYGPTLWNITMLTSVALITPLIYWKRRSK